VDYVADHRRLSAIARQSFTAIKTDNIGPGGATGDLLTLTFKELDELTDRLQPPLNEDQRVARSRRLRGEVAKQRTRV
jgi:hypothetical protein